MRESKRDGEGGGARVSGVVESGGVVGVCGVYVRPPRDQGTTRGRPP